jgi:D-lactate dehydrogenase (cytochrome)
VAFPVSTEEVQAIVRACAAHDVPMVAFGAGSSLEGHVIPVRGGVSIDLTRMNRIVRLSVDDLDVTVEAGVTRKQLEKHLQLDRADVRAGPWRRRDDRRHGGHARVGDDRCPLRNDARGRARLTVVLADGRVIHTGSRARKSSAGYDLTRLFVGSEGTLGIITEVTLRLAGRPEAVAAATCAFDSIDDAVQTVITTIQLGVPVARIELLDDVQIDAVNRHSKLSYPVAPTLFFEFHGLSEPDVTAQAEEVAAIAGENHGRAFERAVTPEHRAALWQARHDAFYAALALRPGASGWTTDVCVPISKLADCIRETKADLATSPLVGPLVGHAGDGNFHLIFPVHPEDPAEMAEAERLTERLVTRALAMGGTCSGEHGVGLGKMKYLEREHGAEALDVMRAIKQALDPKELMNPGKLLPE